MSRRRIFTLLGGGVLLTGIVVAGIVLSRGERTTEVRIEEVARRDLVSTVLASGQISPKRAVDISSDITARIIQLPVEEGQYVERDQLLVRLQPDDFEANVARAQANLSTARANALQARVNRDATERQLERFQELAAQDPPLVSQQQVEDAQQAYDVAVATAQAQEFQVRQQEAALRETQSQLAKTVIRAPMAGQITRLEVEEGEFAIASTFSRETGLLMTVSDLSVIQVEVRVDETDVVRLSLGDSTDIEIDAFPDTSFAGRVTRISQSARQAAGQPTGEDRAVDYDVEITLDNPPPDVRPDLSATAQIVTDTRFNALSVPIIALTQREHRALASETVRVRPDTGLVDTEGVFVVQNGAAQFRPVAVGIAGEEHFEVVSGLSEGDSIVAGPYQVVRGLTDSTLVRPMAQPGGEAQRNARGTVATAQAETPPAADGPDDGPAAMEPAEAVAASTDDTSRPTRRYAVQVAAVRTESAAHDLMTRLRDAGYEPTMVHDAQLYKVRIGDFETRGESQELANELRETVGGSPFVVERT